MKYDEAINYIENVGKFGMNLGLERIRRLCELMGNPQDNLKFIHIAGTNGKGSTSAFVSSILEEEGYKVGVYTSPYIERFTERIRINKDEISEVDVVKYIELIIPLIERIVKEGFENPTEFEIITALAFKYFYDKKVDFVVLEVGLGGRYDATNVVNPLVSVITTISYDHMNVLGDTLDKIAYEKAGIIKPNKPLVLYPQMEEARDVIINVANQNNSKIYFVESLIPKINQNSVDGIKFNISGYKEYKNLHINLLGEHQVYNSLTSIMTIEALRDLGINISNKSIYEGLKNAKWPGRFEILNKNPYIVLDGGHNIQGIESLVKSVKHYFEGSKVKIVVGMLKDKEYIKMIEMLFKASDEFITVTPDSPRALKSYELRDIIISYGKNAIAAKDVEEAVKMGLDLVKGNDVLLFCGSLYMIGHARSILKKVLN
ncbi:Folylpolyglutamate synthase [Caloramator mitchellensis]|uniref:Dihydrofolate synthase/folylpolyglutamate synthase n=1 Tax=Caloramator mitchellensis TaxID=908809 RepID=A0A0R3K2T5_CALMK|nr:folylpolyglutamate synthase/dihydrofolate synthase family protein [Caloramator mitchellensis]KRQ87234.1 Folylpolyglutamate synthase [Caloramator mitchellensis]